MPTEKLKEKLKEVQNILLEIDYLKNDIENINKGQEEYFENIIKNSIFWGRIFRLSKIGLVIDLCKLMAPKEHYSLKNLLNYANQNYPNIDWAHKPESVQIQDCISAIDLIEKNYLPGLKILRDKYFAHLDEDRNKFTLSTDFKDCWYILNEIKNIYNELSWWLIGNTTLFWPENKRPTEILQLHRFKKLFHFIQEKRKLEPSNDLLDEIRDIMRGR